MDIKKIEETPLSPDDPLDEGIVVPCSENGDEPKEAAPAASAE